jgi:hypothetical protein
MLCKLSCDLRPCAVPKILVVACSYWVQQLHLQLLVSGAVPQRTGSAHCCEVALHGGRQAWHGLQHRLQHITLTMYVTRAPDTDNCARFQMLVWLKYKRMIQAAHSTAALLAQPETAASTLHTECSRHMVARPWCLHIS